MAKISEKKKHREAALKAWGTIKSQKRKKGAVSTGKITEFTIQAHQKISEGSGIQETGHHWIGNRIVVPFDKTPPDIACGRFWELRWAYGCPFNCSYCFLRGTMRGKMKPQYVRTELVLQALDNAFAEIKTASIFNSGELSDSLMNPPLMEPIVNKFEDQKLHKIYLLSKCGTRNINFLTDKPRKQVICGWSINATEAAKRWEIGAALPEDRIQAAAQVSNAGYETRIRIDPIFPIKDWKTQYSDLLELIFSRFTPNRIVLGTPRGLWKTIHYATEANVNLDWVQFFGEDSSWGKKVAFQQRKEIYEFFFEKLKAIGFNTTNISLCKETIDMWKSLGLSVFPGICNCYSSRVVN